jgi:hypothetical protein
MFMLESISRNRPCRSSVSGKVERPSLSGARMLFSIRQRGVSRSAPMPGCRHNMEMERSISGLSLQHLTMETSSKLGSWRYAGHLVPDTGRARLPAGRRARLLLGAAECGVTQPRGLRAGVARPVASSSWCLAGNARGMRSQK